MTGRRAKSTAPLLKEGFLPVLPWLLALCGGVVAKECSSRAETSLRMPGWCLCDVGTSTCELLNNVNRIKTGHKAQLPQAAIPLPPSYSMPKLKSDSKRPLVRGVGMVEDLKNLDKGVKGLDKVRMEEVYEGSFNFAYPGYGWLDDVRASVGYYGESLGPELPEEARKIAGGGLDELALMKPVGIGRSRLRASVDTEKVQMEENPLPQPPGVDWTLYSGVLLCGPFFFGLLMYGLYVRFLRRSSMPSSLDLGQELESDDDDLLPMETRRSTANWRALWRAILNSTDSGGEEFSGGMTMEQIEKLPLIPHDDEGHCRSCAKFRCIICLNDVKQQEMLREIPCCGHRFHSSCVDPWLERSATCPLCRRDVVVKKDGDEEVQQEDGEEGFHQDEESIESASTGEPQNLDDIPDSPQALDPVTPRVVDSASTSGQYPGEEGGDMVVSDVEPLPRSFGAATSETDEWSEPEAPGSVAGFEVDGWEIVDGGS